MDNFLFVLGSNWQLSIAELDNVLKYSQFKGRIIDYSANIAIVQFETLQNDKHYINRLMELQYMLGGTQKIAKIYDFIDLRTITNAFPLRIERFKLVENTREKFLLRLEKLLDRVFSRIKNESLFFAVSIYPNLYDDEYYREILVKHFLPFLNTEIMGILKQKGARKSLYYEYPKKNLKSGNLNPIFPHHLIKYGLFNKDRAEIIFGFTEEGVYIGRTFTADDPNFKKKIDEERPFKEFKSSISPKLSLMMLNFLNLFENREQYHILDPFVGNGTILLFALIEDFNIYGSDKDVNKTNNTIRNVYWILNELNEPIPPLLKENFKAIDISVLSNHFKYEFFDGVCTEPSLGPFYKKKPYYNEVMELFEAELEPLYENAFREIHKILKPAARLCIVTPIISSVDGGDLQMDINRLALENKFKLIPILDKERIVNKSNNKLQFRKQHLRNLIDAKKGQILKRKIFVFEKNK
ncbi:MAG: TRM11 family SAM-dependent methyltransferase [Candidatus Hermodarchaeota archaeon]